MNDAQEYELRRRLTHSEQLERFGWCICERNEHELKECGKVSNVVSWIPKPNNRILMYEVLDEADRSEFGSENVNEALAWFSRNPLNKRIVVTNWFADDEDAAPLGETIDLTSIVLASIAYGRGRA